MLTISIKSNYVVSSHIEWSNNPFFNSFCISNIIIIINDIYWKFFYYIFSFVSWAIIYKYYLKSFEAFFKVLKPGGRAVIILPVINSQTLDILPAIALLGFTTIKLSAEDRPSLVYSRPGQRIIREIFVFEKSC